MGNSLAAVSADAADRHTDLFFCEALDGGSSGRTDAAVLSGGSDQPEFSAWYFQGTGDIRSSGAFDEYQYFAGSLRGAGLSSIHGKGIQIFCLLPTTINGIIVATSVLSLYAGSGTILANRIVMLTLIYCVFVMPVTYQGIRNSLYAVNMKGILEAAQMLGCGKFYSFMVIVVPSILPGVCGSALMSLAGLFGDFAIIKIIASSQFETAQAYLYRNRSTDAQSLSASVVILLLITLLINYSVHRSQNRKKERREA